MPRLFDSKQFRTDLKLSGSFSGSFQGDGSAITNVPASGIVGLNLSQIASGSATASISPNKGLQVNTSISASIVSGSTLIIAPTGSFEHIITDGETIEFRNPSTKAQIGRLKFDPTTGLNIQDNTGARTKVRAGRGEFLSLEAGPVGFNSIGAITGSIISASSTIFANDIEAFAMNVTNFTASFITASTVETSGSNIFGDEPSDTHTFVGDIIAQNNISSSGYISGSVFSGDGSGLINIPASGITGLNLSQIASGSVTASISPDKGLVINTNISASGYVSASHINLTGGGNSVITVPNSTSGFTFSAAGGNSTVDIFGTDFTTGKVLVPIEGTFQINSYNTLLKRNYLQLYGTAYLTGTTAGYFTIAGSTGTSFNIGARLGVIGTTNDNTASALKIQNSDSVDILDIVNDKTIKMSGSAQITGSLTVSGSTTSNIILPDAPKEAILISGSSGRTSLYIHDPSHFTYPANNYQYGAGIRLSGGTTGQATLDISAVGSTNGGGNSMQTFIRANSMLTLQGAGSQAGDNIKFLGSTYGMSLDSSNSGTTLTFNTNGGSTPSQIRLGNAGSGFVHIGSIGSANILKFGYNNTGTDWLELTSTKATFVADVSSSATSTASFGTYLGDGSQLSGITPPSGRFGISDGSGSFTYYSSLSASMAAATSGDSIEAFANVTVSGSDLGVITLKDGVDINLNGYEYAMSASGTESTFTDGGSAVSCNIFNGIVKRIGSTESGYKTNNALLLDNSSTEVFCDGVTFESDGPQFAIFLEGGSLKGAKAKNTGTGGGIGIYDNTNYTDSAVDCQAYSTGTGGDGIYVHRGNIINCYGYSNAGYGIRNGGASENLMTNCVGESDGDSGIKVGGGARVQGCHGFSTSGVGIEASGGTFANIVESSGYSSNGAGVDLRTGGNYWNVHGVSDSGGAGISIINGSGDIKLGKSTAQANADAAVYILNNNASVDINGLEAYSLYDNTDGNALEINGSSTERITITDSVLKVTNAGANCLYAASSKNLNYLRNTFKGATVAVNTNITQYNNNVPDNQANIHVTSSVDNSRIYSGSFSGSYVGDGSGLTGVEAFPFSGSAVITGSLTVSGSVVDFASASAVNLNIESIPLINPQVEYVNCAAVTASGATVPLPNSLTFVSSSIYEYIEIFINGLRMRYDVDFAPRSTSTIQYFVTIPSGSEITYKSLKRP